MRAVKRSAVNGNPQLCSLQNGVLLRVDGIADLSARAGFNIQLTAHAFAAFAAGFQSGGRTVVACSHNTFVFDDDSANASAFHIAACPFRNQIGHLHKTNIPLIHSIRLLRLSSIIEQVISFGNAVISLIFCLIESFMEARQ